MVADPGFANAVLSRVNEGVDSNSISDESRRILTEMKEKCEKLNECLNLMQSSDDCEIYETNTELLPEPGQEGFNTDRFGAAQLNQNASQRTRNGTIDDTNNNNNMDNGKYISFEDFQKYTENLSEIIADLQSAIANYKTELDSVKKEKEGIKPTETFEDGKTDNSAIAALVADEVNAKVSEVQEKYNNLKKYTMYLAEQLDKSISHQDYIVENANDILKKQDEIIKHNNYIVEGMNNIVAHNDYIVESINSKEENALNEENKVVRENNKPTENQKPEQKTDENKEEKFNSKKYQSEINEKLGNLISTVKTHYEETKKKEVEQIAESKKAIENSNEFMLVNYIPERLKEKWANLSDERKQEILAESKMLVIKDANTATYFWNTRDMREKRVEMKKVEEQVTANHNNNPVNEGLSDRQKMMSEMIKYRMRK